ncbi:MAG: flagellar filament outer layer protein FlaA [Termitinemataceae bacterium]|nr:MAG: flagellar filament outer layer protein FlaA [Termitinemataceae bacterium]
MKRISVFVAVSFLAVGSLFADEGVLIDFTKLVPDILTDTQNPQNKQTTMDFSRNAGTNYTDEQKQVMKTSLAIPNWVVRLSSSSRTVTNDGLSYAKVVNSKLYGQIMGIRVHFPTGPFNSNVTVKPPFEIPSYEFTQVSDDGTVSPPAEPPNFNTTQSRFQDGYGIVKNVGAVKSLKVAVYGLNFPHSLSAIFIDGSGKEQTVFLGYLNFDGWSDLTWNNPQYVSEVRSRSLRIFPLYPGYAPYIRFAGFLIQRDGASEGGDFVTYFKDVQVVYDKAQLETDKDIDDESEWNIIAEREADRQKVEFKNFGKDQVYRFLEQQKMAPETNFDDDSRANQAAGGAAAQ